MKNFQVANRNMQGLEFRNQYSAIIQPLLIFLLQPTSTVPGTPPLYALWYLDQPKVNFCL